MDSHVHGLNGPELYDLRREILREAATEVRAHLDLNLRCRKVISSLGGLYLSPDVIDPNP